MDPELHRGEPATSDPSGPTSQPATPGRADPPAGEVRLRDHRPGDEPVIAALLDTVQRGAWGDEALWRWRHAARPGFRSEEVVLAMVGDTVVGSFHGAVLPLKLEDGLVVPMSFDGDYAVLPEHRKRDIPVQAHDLTDERLRARQVIFRGGFTSRELNERLYHRRFGYVFVPGVTTQYRKILGPGPLAPRVAALGESVCMRTAVRQALARPMVVSLAIPDFPACHLVLASQGFRLERGPAPAPDVKLRLPYSLLASLGGGMPPFGVLARAFLKGQLSVSVRPTAWSRVLVLALALFRR